MEEEVGEEQFHNEDKEDKRICLPEKKIKIVTILKNKQISERSQENISIKSEK